MRNKFFLAMAMAVVFCSVSFAQALNQVTETMYVLPVKGQEHQFESAVKAHNAKYHPEGGAYAAGLRLVDYGDKTGWY